MRKSTKTTLVIILIIAIVTAIIIIENIKDKDSISEKDIRCIANNSKLYISKTCGHCAQQKSILGEYIGIFNVTDCVDFPDICIEKGIQYVPTWVINRQHQTGILSLKELLSRTGCE